MGEIFVPNLMWFVLALWVAPAVAGLGLVVTILISSRAEGFQDAYQLSALIVLPILLLVIGQATGIMVFSTALVFVMGLVFWLLDGLLLWVGGKSFQRTTLFKRL